MHNDIKEILYTQQQIEERVAQLGKQITQDYRGKDLLIVGVLKGSWIYLADLMRAIELKADVDFVSLSSYGSGTSSSGSVRVLKKLSASCQGRDVLVVEDIVDSGLTLSYLVQTLLYEGAKSVEITTLLSKPSRRKTQIDVKYVGFEIPDKFVVGYGMDYAEKYRNLRYVGVLKEEVYSE